MGLWRRLPDGDGVYRHVLFFAFSVGEKTGRW
jgi:hypothetical protein